MHYPKVYDVIVIGGGHAGTEAALAAARMGRQTLLLTHNIETLGQMSCNPAIGGIGKSHLVREIDALGGAMALAADKGGIQFRILNSRKGAAVRATRAQADRVRYKAAIRETLENQANLDIFQQAADDLIVEGDTVKGVVTQMGIRFDAKTVVLTAGTFLGGVIHVGLEKSSGGRAGDPPSISLAHRLRELQLPVGRLKTGTPPRIDARSVDFSVMTPQPGDFLHEEGVCLAVLDFVPVVRHELPPDRLFRREVIDRVIRQLIEQAVEDQALGAECDMTGQLVDQANQIAMLLIDCRQAGVEIVVPGEDVY